MAKSREASGKRAILSDGLLMSNEQCASTQLAHI